MLLLPGLPGTFISAEVTTCSPENGCKIHCLVYPITESQSEQIEKENPDFVFCGVHTGESLARHCASGDVFLFPSLTETFGNVTLEAMASGLAVVAYRYAAAGIHIEDRHSGMLADYDRPQQFIARARRLVARPALRERMRPNARAAAEQVNWDRICDRFEQILRLSRNGRCRTG